MLQKPNGDIVPSQAYNSLAYHLHKADARVRSENGFQTTLPGIYFIATIEQRALYAVSNMLCARFYHHPVKQCLIVCYKPWSTITPWTLHECVWVFRLMCR